MKNNKLLAIYIKPNKKPELIELTAGAMGFLEILDKVNIDQNENPFSNRLLDVTQITKSLHIFVREECVTTPLPLNRTIGHVKFYGAMILANMDSTDELVTMTHSEAEKYCKLFEKSHIDINTFKKI